jgi:Asp/Glu/hydantoin racemase
MRIMFLSPTSNGGGTADVGFDVAKVEKQLNSYASPGTKVEFGFPDDYAGSVVYDLLRQQKKMNGAHHMLQAPSLFAKTVWAAENGYDAVVQSNTFEPGVEGGRMLTRIPVIGLLRTALHMATNLCDKVGIVVPLESHVAYTARLVRGFGLENLVAGIRGIGVYGPRLEERKAEITGITVDLIKGLVHDGAQMIIPLGGLLIPIVVDPVELEKATGAPVLNIMAIGIGVAELCVRLGLTQSPLAYDPAEVKHHHFSEFYFDKK